MSKSAHPPEMLVDAYNVIGAWSWLQELKDSASLDRARRELIEAMTNFSHFHGYRTTLVFDAYNQTSPAVVEKITKNLKLHYTDYRQTADTFIEKTCARLNRHPLRHLKRIIVVTSDRAQKTVTTGYGAEWMSAEALEQEVALSNRHIKRHQRPKKHASAQTLRHLLDPSTFETLDKMRKGLK
jgi:predicted RNA-binding protein with PIN domain